MAAFPNWRFAFSADQSEWKAAIQVYRETHRGKTTANLLVAHYLAAVAYVEYIDRNRNGARIIEALEEYAEHMRNVIILGRRLGLMKTTLDAWTTSQYEGVIQWVEAQSQRGLSDNFPTIICWLRGDNLEIAATRIRDDPIFAMTSSGDRLRWAQVYIAQNLLKYVATLEIVATGSIDMQISRAAYALSHPQTSANEVTYETFATNLVNSIPFAQESQLQKLWPLLVIAHCYAGSPGLAREIIIAHRDEPIDEIFGTWDSLEDQTRALFRQSFTDLQREIAARINKPSGWRLGRLSYDIDGAEKASREPFAASLIEVAVLS